MAIILPGGWRSFFDEAIHAWENDWTNVDYNNALLRLLHTFKGGARLVGLQSLGDLSHDFETFLIENEGHQLTYDFFERIHDFQDKLHQGISVVVPHMDGAKAPIADATTAITVANITEGDSSTGDQTKTTDPNSNSSVTTKPDRSVKVKVNTLPDVTPETALAPEALSSKIAAAPKVVDKIPVAIKTTVEKGRSSKTNIRVSADLIEKLVNLAGETSISCSRIEEQISDMDRHLDVMDRTIQILQEKVRRLDIETEAQVLFRQEQIAAEASEFDPLEMDRYTQAQQLTRSLIESASDLIDLKSTLVHKVQDTETILLQQSRINTELQEGLMRSRMVRFSTKTQQLRSIVRQTSSVLNKSVDIEFDNVEGELDRIVLEKVTPSLEHMLRNAIYHGIEDTETRIRLGKPPTGHIVLSLKREGSDMLLRLADDGRGINREAVRQKAIEENFISTAVNLSDQEILQLILLPGFSTASRDMQPTDRAAQIAGRGVGMDVVDNDIKQVGGSLFIESTFGEGTIFNIRLPLTVSVSRVLMVMIGDNRYAVPLNTIEGIVLIKSNELKRYYSSPNIAFVHGEKNYQIRYLASIIPLPARPKLGDDNLSLPVLLVRSGDRAIALQVDELQGSREIVVKSIGPQFNVVQGLTGVTIMGDGSVVVILDLHALLRRDALLGHKFSVSFDLDSENTPANKNKLVMVVDDSVTVRKVTTRLLEREGFDVVTAEDGVEAMNLLQDYYPDVMLLDIEMPRMDGFEVATSIRSSSLLNKLPIIMITSRTGEKHRQRGLSLGINRYMGKPYQEDELISNIHAVLEMTT